MMPQGDKGNLHVLLTYQSSDLQPCLDALETLRQQVFLHFEPATFLLERLNAATNEREQADILKLMGNLDEPLVEEALTTLLERLETFTPALIREVVSALPVAQAEEVLNLLACLLEDIEESSDEPDQWEAYLPAEVIVALLDHPQVEVCAGALDVLNQLPSQSIPIEIVLPYCSHEQGSIREEALRTLWVAERRVPPGPFLAALHDPDPRVRAIASHACMFLVAWFGEQIPLEPLLQALTDELPQVREDILDALGKTPERTPVEPVVAALTDSNYCVRCAAVETLGFLGQRVPRSTSPIIAAMAMSDPDSRVRQRAASTLLKLT